MGNKARCTDELRQLASVESASGGAPEASRRRRWPGWLPLLPALLASVVALRQIHLVRTEHLDPWKGGGFGMFSTTGGGPNRHLHVYLSAAGGEERIKLPDTLEDLEERFRTLPTMSRMQQFVQALSAIHPGRDARVEVWQVQFDPATLVPRVEVIREMRLAATDDDKES